jgi:CDP-paratose 2-epimerase
MDFKRLLITGGAGFVGSNLAMMFKQSQPSLTIHAVDSLKRRGSELNLPRLQENGILFSHVDVRCREDLDLLPEFDLLIDCSAEPSVQCGGTGSPAYILNANLQGTINCLETARVRGAPFLFLSTSRVFPISALNQLHYREEKSRFSWEPDNSILGFSNHGIAEDFPLDGPRSFYGASKLAGELLLQEYVYNYGLKGLINRCGILAGPWQMGKVDQGVITLWVARHYFQKPLQYIGFGGKGKQVRDLLHIADLFDLLVLQIRNMSSWDGRIYNVGGGADVSLSLLELTRLCESVSGRRIDITPVPETAKTDLRIYITDSRKVARDFGWQPRRRAEQIVHDIYHWIDQNPNALKPILA